MVEKGLDSRPRGTFAEKSPLPVFCLRGGFSFPEAEGIKHGVPESTVCIQGGKMKFRFKIVWSVFIILCMFLVTSCSFNSGPPKDFMDSDLKCIAPQGIETSPEIKLKKFIDTLVNKGKWSKDNASQTTWLYIITTTDKNSGGKNVVSMQFIDSTHNDKRVVLLNKIVTNGEELSPADVYTVYSKGVSKSKSNN